MGDSRNSVCRSPDSSGYGICSYLRARECTVDLWFARKVVSDSPLVRLLRCRTFESLSLSWLTCLFLCLGFHTFVPYMCSNMLGTYAFVSCSCLGSNGKPGAETLISSTLSVPVCRFCTRPRRFVQACGQLVTLSRSMRVRVQARSINSVASEKSLQVW